MPAWVSGAAPLVGTWPVHTAVNDIGFTVAVPVVTVGVGARIVKVRVAP